MVFRCPAVDGPFSCVGWEPKLHDRYAQEFLYRFLSTTI